jgi:hypothetical protein
LIRDLSRELPPKLTVGANNLTANKDGWNDAVLAEHVDQVTIARMSVIDRNDETRSPVGRGVELCKPDWLRNFAQVGQVRVHDLGSGIVID